MQAQICMVSGMAAQDQVQDLARRIAPHLSECCVEAFTMCAIVTDAEGKPSRVSFSGAPNGANPEFMPHMQAMDRLATCWCAGQI